MSSPFAGDCLLNIDALYISDTGFKHYHRDRYTVNLNRTLENWLLGLGTGLDPSALNSQAGLILCLLQNSDGLADVLAREFTNSPKSIISYLHSPNAFAVGNSLAPVWADGHGLSFVENYLSISDQPDEINTDDEQPGYHLGTKQIRSIPLAVWTGGHVRNRRREVPIVMVIGEWEHHDISRFIHYCEKLYGSETRLKRLLKFHDWIYHDLYSVFMDWNSIWDSVRDRLGDLDHEVHDQLGTSNILGRMQNLNKSMATNIMLRETLNMQKNSLDTVMEIVNNNTVPPRTIHAEAFLRRGKELLKALEHYWALANGNKEQLQNLLSMMIALEQISQGESVGRLNLLAFTFLPLSFVATIFGMTKFTISPTWYPAYALPMLTLTVITAIILPKLISGWYNWKRRPQQPKPPRLRRRFNTQRNLGEALQETPEKKGYPPFIEFEARLKGEVTYRRDEKEF